jgi:hypothetical protein
LDNVDYSGFDPSWAQDPGSGYSIAPAIGLPANMAPPMPGDMQDMAQMQPYAPAGNAMPWYQQAMMFGIGRAVDNLSRTTVSGNTDPGSFAGYNGRTYSQIPQGQGGGAMNTASASARMTGSPLLLIGLAAVVAFALLHK